MNRKSAKLKAVGGEQRQELVPITVLVKTYLTFLAVLAARTSLPHLLDSVVKIKISIIVATIKKTYQNLFFI